SPKATVPPAERSLASATISLTGNPRSARIESIASPTAPVAPTTATLYCLPMETPSVEGATGAAQPGIITRGWRNVRGAAAWPQARFTCALAAATHSPTRAGQAAQAGQAAAAAPAAPAA